MGLCVGGAVGRNVGVFGSVQPTTSTYAFRQSDAPPRLRHISGLRQTHPAATAAALQARLVPVANFAAAAAPSHTSNFVSFLHTSAFNFFNFFIT